MKTTGITKIMECFGCSDGVPARIKELKTINLRSNGNQELNPLQDEITFDIGNELIKIKEYDCEIVSGLFLECNVNNSEITDYTIGKCKNFRNRISPKIGDTLIYIKESDSSTKIVGSITDIIAGKIIADKALPNVEGYYIAYMRSSDYADSSQLFLDPRYFVRYKPLTEYKADIYLSFFSVVGFSTITPYY